MPPGKFARDQSTQHMDPVKLAPAFIKNRYLNLRRRLEHLETSVRHLDMALDALVRSPRYVAGDDVGFNGQLCRKRTFCDMASEIPFDRMLETGTWLGNTTAYLAQTARKPVVSCEVNPRFHALAKMRLADIPGIQLELKDSRQFLEQQSRSGMTDKCTFFYLDAHWYEDLPLVEEIDLVAGCWSRFVVMIDDFQVPDDAGYGYDEYEHGGALTLELVRPVLAKHQLSIWFPRAPSSQETGGRRGSVTLAPPGELTQKLSNVASLRAWPQSV